MTGQARYGEDGVSRREVDQLRTDLRAEIQQLGQRISDINAHGTYGSAQAMIGRAEYVTAQQGINDRFEALHHRIDETRRELSEDIKAVREDAKAAVASRQSWRTIVYTGLVPALVVLAGILWQIWHTGKGG